MLLHTLQSYSVDEVFTCRFHTNQPPQTLPGYPGRSNHRFTTRSHLWRGHQIPSELFFCPKCGICAKRFLSLDILLWSPLRFCTVVWMCSFPYCMILTKTPRCWWLTKSPFHPVNLFWHCKLVCLQGSAPPSSSTLEASLVRSTIHAAHVQISPCILDPGAKP